MIVYGIPFLNSKSKIITSRLEYLEKKTGIKMEEFISFDAMRQVSQCIGRVIRNKKDYGIMILVDKRFNSLEKRKKLPLWISQFLEEDHINLSTDSVISIAQQFLKEMSQPFKMN